MDGVGEISFPITASQAKGMKEVGSQVPYFKDTETVVDIEVRDLVQVEPSMVTISNPNWHCAMQELSMITVLPLPLLIKYIFQSITITKNIHAQTFMQARSRPFPGGRYSKACTALINNLS